MLYQIHLIENYKLNGEPVEDWILIATTGGMPLTRHIAKKYCEKHNLKVVSRNYLPRTKRENFWEVRPK